MKTLHILVKGKVQGVFFRATARDKALSMQLCGWAKNTSEGNVEIVVSGSEENLNRFIFWCNKGPDRARVQKVEVKEMPVANFSEFKIERE